MKKKIFTSLILIYLTLFLSALIFFTAWKIEFKKQEKITEKYGCEFKEPAIQYTK